MHIHTQSDRITPVVVGMKFKVCALCSTKLKKITAGASKKVLRRGLIPVLRGTTNIMS